MWGGGWGVIRRHCPFMGRVCRLLQVLPGCLPSPSGRPVLTECRHRGLAASTLAWIWFPTVQAGTVQQLHRPGTAPLVGLGLQWSVEVKLVFFYFFHGKLGNKMNKTRSKMIKSLSLNVDLQYSWVKVYFSIVLNKTTITLLYQFIPK